MNLKEIIKKIIFWRILTIIVALLAIPALPVRTGFTYLYNFFTFPDLYNMWANFDGINYLDIAKWGYGYPHHTDQIYAFFPIFPWVVRIFSFSGYYVASGLFVSHLCLIFALYYLYRLLRIDYPQKTVKLTIFLMLIFPTSFFFGSVYSESLFLLLSVLSFYLIRRGDILPAVILAGIASATRVTGILLWPALLLEYYFQSDKSIKKMLKPELVWFLIPPIGLLSYMKFQFQKTGNALFFVTSQPNFGAGRAIDKVILLHQVIFRYVKMMIFVDHRTATFFTAFLEFIIGIFFLSLILYGIKKIRLSYLFYSGFSYLLPTLTGTFLSMPRFVLVLFPVFALLATILEKQRPFVRYIFYTINIILGVVAISLFTRGYFVG